MNEQTALTRPDDEGAGERDQRRRVGWPEVGLAFLAALVLYGIGIAIIWSVPDDQSELAGIVQYSVSGLAPLGAFAAVLWLRVLDPPALGLRRVAWKWVLISIGAGIGVILLNILVTIVVITLILPRHPGHGPGPVRRVDRSPGQLRGLRARPRDQLHPAHRLCRRRRGRAVAAQDRVCVARCHRARHQQRVLAGRPGDPRGGVMSAQDQKPRLS